MFAERSGPSVRIRDGTGAWRQAAGDLKPYDSMLTHCAEPRDAIELLVLREAMREWRFYDHFRTDPEAPARLRQVATRTPVLASDGSDLAAAVATIEEVGDGGALDASIADAFPGGSIGLRQTDSQLELEMRQHGLLRPLGTAECPTARCATCCWSPPCSRRGRRN